MEQDPQIFWQQVLDELILILDKGAVSTWLTQTSILEQNEKKIVIACPSPYAKSIIEARYANQIKELIKKRTHKNFSLEFKTFQPILKNVSGPLFDQLPTIDSNFSNQAKTQNLQNQGNLNSNYTFDNFVVGVSNRVAYSAALTVTEKPGGLYNPLFLHGGTGVGKTHLLHAIGNDLLKKLKLNVLYCSAEQFLNNFISFIAQKKNMQEFKKIYRERDALLIDDFQFMGGKQGTQEEFFHTFNALQAKQSQIVIASDKLPKDIANLAQRLISRFDGGLIVDITVPDYETRLAILRNKAQNLSLDLNSEILHYLAEKITSNVRELEGILLKIKAQSLAQDLPVTMGLAKEILQDLPQSFPLNKRITPELVLNLISETFDSNMSELCGKKRKKEIVIPRQVAMYLLRAEIGLNFSEIGEILGGRDHSTVLHGNQKILNELKNNDQFLKTTIERIRQNLYSQK